MQDKPYYKQINNAIDDILGTAEAMRTAYITGTGYPAQLDRQVKYLKDKLTDAKILLNAAYNTKSEVKQ